MRAVLHLPAHHGGAGRADALAPGDESGGRPFEMRAVRGGHVLGGRGVRAALRAQGVHGHALIAAEDFHGGSGDAQLHHGAHQPVRHAVVRSSGRRARCDSRC